MSQEYFGIKELYDVTLKTTIPMKVGNRDFEAGEPILYFDKVMISMIEEETTRNFAKGGKNNPNLIMWENTQAVNFSLQEGVMSRLGFAMLTNANVISRDASKEFVIVPKRQDSITNENGRVKLQFTPLSAQPIFIYNSEGLEPEKITNYTIVGDVLEIPTLPNTNIMAVYYFEYHDKFETYQIGEKLFNGYLKLEGKIYFKDDVNGYNKTSILEMPRVRLTSQLSLRIGERADPVVSTFTVVGFPGDSINDKKICSLTLLDEDIDYDI